MQSRTLVVIMVSLILLTSLGLLALKADSVVAKAGQWATALQAKPSPSPKPAVAPTPQFVSSDAANSSADDKVQSLETAEPSFDETIEMFIAKNPSASLVEVVAVANAAVEKAGLGLPFRNRENATTASLEGPLGKTFLVASAGVDPCQNQFTVVPVSKLGKTTASVIGAAGKIDVDFAPSLMVAIARTFNRKGKLVAEIPVPYNTEPSSISPTGRSVYVPYALRASTQTWWKKVRPASAPETSASFLIVTFTEKEFHFSSDPAHYRQGIWEPAEGAFGAKVLTSGLTNQRIEMNDACF